MPFLHTPAAGGGDIYIYINEQKRKYIYTNIGIHLHTKIYIFEYIHLRPSKRAIYPYSGSRGWKYIYIHMNIQKVNESI